MIKTRVTCPRNSDIYRTTYLTRSDVDSITALRKKRDMKFGHGRHTNTVMELPDEVRSAEAIPAAIAEMLWRSLEEKQGILDIGEWRIDIHY
jgi:hypothetical protein